MKEEMLRGYIRSILLEKDTNQFKPSSGAYVVPDGVPKPKKEKKIERNFLEKIGSYIDTGIWDQQPKDPRKYRDPSLNDVIDALNVAKKKVNKQQMSNFLWGISHDYFSNPSAKFESILFNRVCGRILKESNNRKKIT